MRLVNHAHRAIDLRTTPVHLGLGSSANPVEGFAWDPEVLRAYGAAVAADGAEGRLVTIIDGEGPGDHWERHPSGDEMVVCLSGSVTVIRDVAGVAQRVVLGAGEATVNPAGAWHAVDMAGPAVILTITPGLGTEHRPRTDTSPTEHVGNTPSTQAP
ncbi:cupin domain-containing protein [Streptomyces sp. 3MP-14]|uniref:Cupin domain-containing protein n=1 Tax=Streptomyces mimosae TaxID=2586635 RepID=A0A5N6A2A7_9ACTN|nr:MULTISPECIES: cupin domain-containing protein [Streptomyces]KAB8162904.1 cupin domain-containing protein [Streptomyces mimosae]KAB8179117.1 cupin domain-containing protein [Streptomyces sp. 3MP-14]